MQVRHVVAGAAFALFALSSTSHAQPAAAASAPVAQAAPESSPAPAAAPAAESSEGKVAYYGSKFHGRKTASGERFNPAALTMAHRSLPFGTLVRVTLLKSKRSVVVRVNDRGPTTPDRIGDLSLAAARRLHMLHSGVAEVRLDVVGHAKAHAGHRAHRTTRRSERRRHRRVHRQPCNDPHFGAVTMSFASDFKEFAMKGNVVDLAVGVIIGAAFGKIVDSIVKDLIMPLVGKALGGLDFSSYFIMLSNAPADYKGPMTYEALTKAGVPLFAYGNFITVSVNFLILAVIIFMMVKQVNRMKKAAPPAAAPATPEDVILLRQIRDSLQRKP